MDETSKSFLDKVISIDKALQDANVPFGVSGAIALSNYVREYRGTDDIDIGVFLPVEEGLEILNILSGLGASTDDIDLDIVRRGEWVKVYWDDTPVDIFFASTEVGRRGAETTRPGNFAGTQIPIVSAEVLMFFKMGFNRGQDWLDIRAMLLEDPQIDTQWVSEALVSEYGSRRGIRRRIRRLSVIRRSVAQQLAKPPLTNSDNTHSYKSGQQPKNNTICGHWMPIAKRRCVLPADHRGKHRR